MALKLKSLVPVAMYLCRRVVSLLHVFSWVESFSRLRRCLEHNSSSPVPFTANISTLWKKCWSKSTWTRFAHSSSPLFFPTSCLKLRRSCPPAWHMPTIYTFWHSERRPAIVDACIARMRDANPTYDIVVLGPADLPDWLTISREWQIATDWLRLKTLEEHGGVWLDASCICVESVDAWIDPSADASGFESYRGCVDNYAIAAPARSPFVTAWREELEESIRDKAAYVARNASVARDASIVWPHAEQATIALKLPYLVAYLAGGVARRRLGARVALRGAYYPGGSLFFPIESLFAPSYVPHTPLIKLDKVDRRIADHAIKGLTDVSSQCARLLKLSSVPVRRSKRVRSLRVP